MGRFENYKREVGIHFDCADSHFKLVCLLKWNLLYLLTFVQVVKISHNKPKKRTS